MSAVETKSPTVYFVDDSATMREVMKIAFRRENIAVIASHDAVTALAEIERVRPDVVITDVIMPQKDGFEVCRFIKEHPLLSHTPVVLLSGVVDREVAEKATAVKADDLVRKPFQPQELIARVKRILAPKTAAPAAHVATAPAPAPKPAAQRPAGLSGIFGGKAPAAAAPAAVAPAPVAPTAPTAPSTDVAKLKVEVLRLESLVKRLQAELAAERDYARSLEEAVKTLQAV